MNADSKNPVASSKGKECRCLAQNWAVAVRTQIPHSLCVWSVASQAGEHKLAHCPSTALTA